MHVYSDNPVETAKKFVASGAAIIHVVDLDAAVKSDPKRNEKTIDRLLTDLGDSVKFQIAGGIRSITNARIPNRSRSGENRRRLHRIFGAGNCD